MSALQISRLPRYEMWDYAKERWRRWRIYSAVGALFCASAVSYMWWNNRAVISDSALFAFESGGRPGWDEDFDMDAAASIKRPDVENKLKELFYPTPEGDLSASYVLIMGEHGTGKSTAVRRVVRDRKGINGAVYVNVPSRVPLFGGLVAEAVGVRGVTVDVEAGIVRRMNMETREVRDVPLSEEPSATWGKAALAIKAAASAFKKKHGRPAVLVIDSAELLAKQAPAFLEELQLFAKQRTDEGNLRMIFVSSDGSVAEQLDSRSASSRGLDPVEVGDICDKDAVEFLKGKGVEESQATEAVRDITGGRFALLQRYVGSWAAKGNEATRADLHKKTMNSLRLAGLDPRHAFFHALVAQLRIDDDPARDMLGVEHQSILRTLLEKNIVAAHPDLTYTFHSRYVETFFTRVFAQEDGTIGGGSSAAAEKDGPSG
jgi:hypothetical protein